MRSKKTAVCCRLLSFNVEKALKILSKKNCRLTTIFFDNIFIYVSTSFDKPGARLFVKYQTNFLQKNACRILQKNIKFCQNLQHFSDKNCSFVSIYTEKCCKFLLVNFLTSTKIYGVFRQGFVSKNAIKKCRLKMLVMNVERCLPKNVVE